MKTEHLLFTTKDSSNLLSGNQIMNLKPEQISFKNQIMNLKLEQLTFKNQILNLKPEQISFKNQIMNLKPEQLTLRNQMLNARSEQTAFTSKSMQPKASQLSFEFASKVCRETGGSLFVGKRKTKRILSSEFPIHLVLKSNQAVKQYAFVNHTYAIEKLVHELSFRYGVRVYSYAIVFDHIHLVIRIMNENLYKSWMRHFASEIIQTINKRTGSDLKNFFNYRPYTRTLSGWGKEFRELCDYIKLNQMEVVGLRPNRKLGY